MVTSPGRLHKPRADARAEVLRFATRGVVRGSRFVVRGSTMSMPSAPAAGRQHSMGAGTSRLFACPHATGAPEMLRLAFLEGERRLAREPIE